MKKFGLILLLGLSLGACGGSSSDEETSEIENTGAAVSSMFSGGVSADTESLLKRFTINSTGATICDADNRFNAPTAVLMSARGGDSAYPYGSASDPMTITTTDFCEDANNQANAGTGPDGDGLFATFILLGDPEGSCDDGSSFSFTKGSGITRNTQEHYPEIYGRFEISGGSVANCTIRIFENGSIDSDNSSCSDDNGAAVALDNSVSCTIDADIAPIADPSYYKGHYGLGESAERNLNYDCITISGYSVDQTDHIMSADHDCSDLTNIGANIEFLSIGAYATDTSEANDFSSWEMDYSGTTHEELRLAVQLLHAEGFQVVLSFDILYYEDPANPDDDVDFPAALINNSAFRDDLTEFIVQEAEFAQDMDADIFVPLSEADRVFALASIDDDEYLAGIIDDVQAAYTGKLAYVWSYDLSEYTATNLVDFDLIGFNRSPQGHDHLNVSCSGTGEDSNCFLTVLEADLTRQQAVIAEVTALGGSPIAFIDSLGVWGNATEVEPDSNNLGEVDWLDDSVNAEMYSAAFTLADTYELGGFVVWEGADGEFVFPSQTETLEVITQGFLGR